MLKILKEKLPNFDQVVQYAMAAAVVVFISFLYPNNVKFKYEFKLGDTWRYEDLRSPFDYAIKKTAQELAADKEQILQKATPYYRLNSDLASAKIKDAEAAVERLVAAENSRLDSQAVKLDAEKYRVEGTRILADIYARHIIHHGDDELEIEAGRVITVVEGKTTFKRTQASFRSWENAKVELGNALKNSKLVWKKSLWDNLAEAVVPDLIFDEELTEKVKIETLAGLVTTKGMVAQAQPIVRRGELVTAEVHQKLESLKEAYNSEIGSKRSERAVYFGYLLITLLIVASLMLYLNAHRKDVLMNWRYLAFLLMWIIGFGGLTFLLERSDALNAYIVPFCIVPIVVSHFFSFRLAFFIHILVALIAGFLTRLGFQFLFIQIIAGVVAMLAVADARDWSKFFRSVLAIVLAYGLAQFAVSVIEEGSLVEMDWEVYGLLAFNGLLTLLAFPLIPLVERLFGFTSSISLVELSDMNRPLLRDLAIKAPGTLQHSLQVGNLCEAAANEIGADALLIRVAALYHDIGKMNHPVYFVENQGGTNPHHDLEPIESAKIIINHVTEGVEMAKKYHLPKIITRFIETHHGTTRADFFYKKQLQQNPGVSIDEATFTYPGPKPATKEEAIMMMADTIEAASRSLKSPSKEDIEELVEKLVAAKVKAGQLDESSLSLGDLAKCKSVFKKMLSSIHHVRIEYPE